MGDQTPVATFLDGQSLPEWWGHKEIRKMSALGSSIVEKISQTHFHKREKLLINTLKFADWLFSEVIWGHNCKSHYRA